jgi:magnesium transporter
MQRELFQHQQHQQQHKSDEEEEERQHYHTQQYGYFEHPHALPFEFQMLECILHKVCREVEMEYDVLQSQVRKTLHDPNLANSEGLLFEILQYKQHMNKFTTFVREMHETVEALLQSDEDMASMYLTETFVHNKPRSVDNHEEIEMLLETYYTQLEDVINRIEELKNDMNSTQEFLEICLDAMRNRIIEYELKMTIAGFAITFGTLLAGLLGMNLINHFEENPLAMYVTCVGIGTTSAIVFAALMFKMKRKGVFVSNLLKKDRMRFPDTPSSINHHQYPSHHHYYHSHSQQQQHQQHHH